LPANGQDGCQTIAEGGKIGAVEGWDDVVEHLVRTTPLSEPVARRLVEEVVDFFDEPAEAFVRRRHGELKAEGLANPAIFARVAAELAVRPVQAPLFSERQIRRLIYG
jgi:hypothetical protein